MRQNHLIIMVKEPVIGRVKTRLARDIGGPAATWWFRHQVRSLTRNLSRDRRWQTSLAVSPDTSLQRPVWSNLPQVTQGAGDLGVRMRRLLQIGLDGPVVIIGGDIPGIQPRHITRAFSALGANDLVFGPATDGGFWLVGAKRGACPVPNQLFDGVVWSQPDTLSKSLETTGRAKIAFADTMQDVDTIKDLQTLRH